MQTSADALARRWFDSVWNKKDDEAIEQILSPNCKGFVVGHGALESREQFKAVRDRFLEAFPDLQLTVEDTISDGNRVVVRWLAKATHCGCSLGPPATGKVCEFRGLTWLEFEGDQLVQGWDAWDLGGLIHSLQTSC